LLDPEFGLKLMDAWGVAHSNREAVAKAAQEQPALVAALGPEAGATVLQNAVWVQAPSPGVTALIQSFRAALKP